MNEGCEVRVAVATDGGCDWIKGHVDRFRLFDGEMRVDVIGWNGKRYPRCSLRSVEVVPQ